jgi:hypothetical protein
MKFSLIRRNLPEYPHLTVWANPCCGCFRDENEAVWYFRANHPGSTYTGVDGERQTSFYCSMLSDAEVAVYAAYRHRNRNNIGALIGDPLPKINIYGEVPQAAPEDTIQHWMERALKAENKLHEIKLRLLAD